MAKKANYTQGQTFGRPTKYKPEFVQEVDVYLEECQDEEYRLIKTEAESSTSYENHIRVKLPTIEGFSLWLSVTKETVYQWRKKYPDFSDSLKKIEEEQRKKLLNEGLSGRYNPTIAKLLLSTNYGYSDKVQNEVSGKEGGAIKLESTEIKKLDDKQLASLLSQITKGK